MSSDVSTSLWEASNAVAISVGMLSMASSVLVCFVYAAFPERRSSWRLLVLMVAVADFGQGYFYVAVGVDSVMRQRGAGGSSDVYCRVNGVIGMWSATASFLWTAALTSYLAYFLRSGMPAKALQASVDARVSLLMVTICYGYPTVSIGAILLSHVPLERDGGEQSFQESYGCFIAHEYCASRLMAIYAPLWTSMLVVCTCSAYVAFKLSALLSLSASTPQLQRNLRWLRGKLLLIPIGFVLLRLPETLYRLIEYQHALWHGCGVSREQNATATRKHHGFEQTSLAQALSMLQAVTNPAQGVLTSIIFVWSSPAYRERLWRWMPCLDRCSHEALEDVLSSASTTLLDRLEPADDRSAPPAA